MILGAISFIAYDNLIKNQLSTIDISKMATGIYFVKLTNSNGTQTTNVIKR